MSVYTEVILDNKIQTKKQHVCAVFCPFSVNQSIFYFMSVHIEVIYIRQQQQQQNKKATKNNIYLVPSVIFQSISQYFMSVHTEVILDNNKKEEETTKQQHIILTYLQDYKTINLTVELIISVSYKISLMLLQALKSYPFL